MQAKYRFMQNKIETVMKNNKKALPENTTTSLFGIFDFIRVQRNDIGHPREEFQVPERDHVFVNLRLFPEYCKTVEKVKNYLKKNKI